MNEPKIRAELPEGLRLLSCERIDGNGESLSRSIRGIQYLVDLPEGAPDVAERLAAFAARPEATVVREREGKGALRIDVKAAVQEMRPEGPRSLRFTVRAGETQATARPYELLSAIFGAEWVRLGMTRIVRESAVFSA